MIHNAVSDISHLLVEIDSLIPLENNPRKGDVPAIAASYSEFGQVKPIVIRPNDNGTSTVIAGNHQLEAAKSLGWTHIAAVRLDADDSRAAAYALADNRTMELGHTDNEALYKILEDVYSDYEELFESLQWDEFEMASMNESATYADKMDTDIGTGYVPPELVIPIGAPIPGNNPSEIFSKVQGIVNDDGETRLQAKESINTSDAVSMGTSAVGLTNNVKAVVQYTLVFDTAEQQRHWYDFVRYLKSSPVYSGETTAERLISFIDSHADF